ncbi:methyltransferase domain-containing protein [Microlunatus aurantiacus]|uniref:Trans-aconitate 2-methyltransferase n=1 Tax=Microlunatus aurantiacus TaxID=446786 RepID=A0ABP7E0P6_9ACTN
MNDWDPAHYGRYADERSRPYGDLVRRIGAERPRRVVDLGCGSGELTASLSRLWPTAEIIGVDSSPAMIEKARTIKGVDDLRFLERDLRDWRPEVGTDVLISNAALQWVPGHRDLLPGLVDRLTPGGWIAFQVPGNFGEPSHVLLHELARTAPYAEHTAGVLRPASSEPADYLADLTALGCTVDVWETTYLHVLTGEDPVFTWVSATGARPVLQALPDDLREQFETDYKERLRDAYPEQAYGTVLPFRRIFVVGQRTGS